MTVSRRRLVAGTAASTLTALAALATLAAGPAAAQTKIKVAAIYTVPVEQQWVSRIDKALKEIGRASCRERV